MINPFAQTFEVEVPRYGPSFRKTIDGGFAVTWWGIHRKFYFRVRGRENHIKPRMYWEWQPIDRTVKRVA